MIMTAGRVRALLSGLPDDAPVFADLWTRKDLESRISDLQEEAASEALPMRDSPDLSDPDTLIAALNCIPDIWAMGDDAEEELMEQLNAAFVVVPEGGAE